jgi:hypothetical protein
MDEVFRRLDAEDRAVVYLANFPPPIALATAVTVEWLKAMVWRVKQSEMIRRGDPREVFCITDDEFRRVRAAFAARPPGVWSDAAEQYIIKLLADFPSDQAWFIAHKVAKWATNNARNERMACLPELSTTDADPRRRSL